MRIVRAYENFVIGVPVERIHVRVLGHSIVHSTADSIARSMAQFLSCIQP